MPAKIENRIRFVVQSGQQERSPCPDFFVSRKRRNSMTLSDIYTGYTAHRDDYIGYMDNKTQEAEAYMLEDGPERSRLMATAKETAESFRQKIPAETFAAMNALSPQKGCDCTEKILESYMDSYGKDFPIEEEMLFDISEDASEMRSYIVSLEMRVLPEEEAKAALRAKDVGTAVTWIKKYGIDISGEGLKAIAKGFSERKTAFLAKEVEANAEAPDASWNYIQNEKFITHRMEEAPFKEPSSIFDKCVIQKAASLGIEGGKNVEINANLKGSNISGADMSGATLSGFSMSECVAKDMDLMGCVVKDSLIQGTAMSGAALSGATVKDTSFYGTDMQGSDFEMAEIHGTEFYDTDLRRSNFRDSTISAAMGQGTDISGCDFSGADLSHVRIDGELRGIESAKFPRALLSEDLKQALGRIQRLTFSEENVKMQEYGMGPVRKKHRTQ